MKNKTCNHQAYQNLASLKMASFSSHVKLKRLNLFSNFMHYYTTKQIKQLIKQGKNRQIKQLIK